MTSLSAEYVVNVSECITWYIQKNCLEGGGGGKGQYIVTSSKSDWSKALVISGVTYTFFAAS